MINKFALFTKTQTHCKRNKRIERPKTIKNRKPKFVYIFVIFNQTKVATNETINKTYNKITYFFTFKKMNETNELPRLLIEPRKYLMYFNKCVSLFQRRNTPYEF